MEDEHLREIASIHSIYLPVRQSIYAILFNVHHQMYLAKKEQGKNEPENGLKVENFNHFHRRRQTQLGFAHSEGMDVSIPGTEYCESWSHSLVSSHNSKAVVWVRSYLGNWKPKLQIKKKFAGLVWKTCGDVYGLFWPVCALIMLWWSQLLTCHSICWSWLLFWGDCTEWKLRKCFNFFFL